MSRQTHSGKQYMQADQKNVLNVAILMDTATTWSRSLIKGILSYKHQQDRVRWHIHLPQQEQTASLVELPIKCKPDGIIARITESRMAENLHQLGVPVVNISRIKLKNAYFPRVINNNEAQVIMAIETLREHGFRQFAYIGNLKIHHEAEHCHDFEKLLKQKERFTPYVYSTQCRGDFENWLRKLPKPIAIYCWSAEWGNEVINTCLRARISIPQDVAVLTASYDALLCELSNPPLSGMLTSTEQIGLKAAATLDDMMHGLAPQQMDCQLLPKGVNKTISINTLAVDDPRLAKVMNFIHAHYLEPLSVPDILRANPMARRSLERKFKHYFGCSVAKQIQRLRIQHARMLLLETDEPVSMIAEKCCFSSYNQLHQAFKSHTGLSPGKFRTQFR